jgi:hypothetical protein
MLRTLIVALALFAALLTSRSARADAKACISAHEQGQVAKNHDSLLEARARFEECATDACPAPIARECAAFLSELAAQIPTVVFQLKHDPGDAIDARVLVDGREIPGAIGGSAAEVDPGRHRFRFEAKDGRTHEVVMDIARAARDQIVIGDFRRDAGGDADGPAPNPGTPAPLPLPDAPEDDSGPSYLGPIVMFAVAGAGLVSFLGLAASGKVEENKLDDCKPRCQEEDVQRMRNRYLGADISLGIAGASLAAAVVWLLVARSEEPDSAAEPAAVSVAFPGQLELTF